MASGSIRVTVIVNVFQDGNHQKMMQQLANPLTPRKLEFVQLMCEGLTNREIAQRMNIAESTAKSYVKLICVDLDVRRREGVIIWAFQNGVATKNPAQCEGGEFALRSDLQLREAQLNAGFTLLLYYALSNC